MINTRKVGEPILFIYGYGVPKNFNEKIYKYGQVVAGFITDIEYVEARDSYLYSVGTLSFTDRCKIMTKIIGPHLIFDLNNLAEAELKLMTICEEPDFNDDEI